jgi:hypothetical protein
VNLLVAILVVALLGVVILVIGAPLRAAARRSDGPESAASASSPSRERVGRGTDAERDELESARAAKYREIRDAELDFRTGKLSVEDFRAIDGELRGEAIEILDRLERLHGSVADTGRGPREAGPASADGAGNEEVRRT